MDMDMDTKRTLLILSFALSLTVAGQDLGGIFGPPGQIRASTFAALGTPSNGSVRYCSDCTQATPCAGGGTGAFATRIAGAWSCTSGSAAAPSTPISVANGGTGTATLTANNVLLGNGTSTLQFVAPGTSGNVLTSNGTTWASSAASGGGATVALDNLASVAINVDLLPGADITRVFGSTTKRWNAAYFGTGNNARIHYFNSSSGDDNYTFFTDLVGFGWHDDNTNANITISGASVTGTKSFTLPNTAGTFALTTSNVATATALAANPTDCSANQFATAIAASGNLTCAQPAGANLDLSTYRGSCTLNGAATPTCTATVVSGCFPVCSYNSAALPHIVACSVTGTTLTAVSGTAVDSGDVNWICIP